MGRWGSTEVLWQAGPVQGRQLGTPRLSQGELSMATWGAAGAVAITEGLAAARPLQPLLPEGGGHFDCGGERGHLDAFLCDTI